MHPSDQNQIFHIEAYYKSGDLAQDPMTVGKHGRLSYKRGTMGLSKLLDDQVVPRSAGGKENMLVVGKLGTTFSGNELIYLLVSANEQVRDELRDLVQSRLDNITLLELKYQTCRTTTFLELCVEK